MRLGYVSKTLSGTVMQGSIVELERAEASSTYAKFITPVNAQSYKGERTIYTELSLAGTGENPVRHNFQWIYTEAE